METKVTTKLQPIKTANTSLLSKVSEKTASKPAPAKTSKDDKEEDERSFFARHKAASIALGVVGVAGIAIAARKLVLSRMEKILTQELDEQFSMFLKKIKTASSADEIMPDAEKFLSHAVEGYKAGAVEKLVSFKHMNENMASKIFDSIASFKTPEVEAFISISQTKHKVAKDDLMSRLFEKMLDKKLFTPTVVDDFITKISKQTADEQLMFADILAGGGSLMNSASRSVLSDSQIEKILKMIKPLKQEEYKVYHTLSKKNVSTERLKIDLEGMLIKTDSYDYATRCSIENLLQDTSYSEGARLGFARKFVKEAKPLNMVKNEALRNNLLFDNIIDFKTLEFQPYRHTDEKESLFELGEDILCPIKDTPFLNLEQKSASIKRLKAVYDKSLDEKISMSYSPKAKMLKYLELMLEMKNTEFNYKMYYATSSDIGPIVDDMLKNIKEVKDFGLYGEIKARLAFSDFEQSFNNKAIYLDNFDDMKAKIEDFGTKEFGRSYSRNTGGSSGNGGWDNSGGFSWDDIFGKKRSGSGYNSGYKNNNNGGRYSNAGGAYGGAGAGTSGASSYIYNVKNGYDSNVGLIPKEELRKRGKAAMAQLLDITMASADVAADKKGGLSVFAEKIKNGEDDVAMYKKLYKKLSTIYHPDANFRLADTKKDELELIFKDLGCMWEHVQL